jgi:3,4-dihydroxy 2-butanone 4-phosphate synthase / GTP cyclohydrolase II
MSRRPARAAKRTPAESNGAGPRRARRAARRSDVFLTVEEAVRRIGAGQMLIVVDDAERENEGDLVFAAEKTTPQHVNFCVKHGRGLLCAPMVPEEADRLGLKLMVSKNTARFGTPFTETVDVR